MVLQIGGCNMNIIIGIVIFIFHLVVGAFVAKVYLESTKSVRMTIPIERTIIANLILICGFASALVFGVYTLLYCFGCFIYWIMRIIVDKILMDDV